MSGSIIGRETGNKPFPLIVHRNAHLFSEIRTVIDIGAGSGRFVKYFLFGEYRCGRRRSNARPTNLYEVKAPIAFPILKYVAIEPHELFCAKLRYMATKDPRLEVVCDLWENVRSKFMHQRFDAVIVWDVAMYMDLRDIHGTSDPVEAVIKELDVWINMAQKFFFSLHPVNGMISSRKFGDILSYLDNHQRLVLVDKSYLNRLYRVKSDGESSGIYQSE